MRITLPQCFIVAAIGCLAPGCDRDTETHRRDDKIDNEIEYRSYVKRMKERLSEADLVSGIRARGTAADFVPRVDDIVSRLVDEVRAGDRVVILSNGGFGGLHDKLLAALKTRGAGL